MKRAPRKGEGRPRKTMCDCGNPIEIWWRSDWTCKRCKEWDQRSAYLTVDPFERTVKKQERSYGTEWCFNWRW